ncbi:hypothetical protein Tco_1574037 [Tanacetum coccineum]
MRLDVPKFLGVDPESWIFAINEYLSLLNTLVDQRLRIVGFNLEDAVVEWFRWMTRNGLITTWARYTGLLAHLFLHLGIKLNLQHELLVSKPTTLGDAFSLARITKARMED